MTFPAFQERLRQLFRRAKFDGGAVSKSTPVVEVVQRWNGASETFVGKDNNITDSASAVGSLLERWRVGGNDLVALRKDGALILNKNSATNDPSIVDSNGHGIAINQSGIALCTNDGAGLRAAFLATRYNLMVQKTFALEWHASGAPVNQNGADVSISRYAAGTIQIQNDLKLRNLLSTGSLATGIVAKSADYTLTANDGTVEVNASGAACTMTLPAVSGTAGRIYVIKKTDSSANAVTVDPNASETIDGATTVSLASQYSTIIIQANAAGTAWHKLASV